MRETISVLFLVALITVLVWAFDLVVGKFIFAPLEHWGHLYGIGAGVMSYLMGVGEKHIREGN